MNNQDISIDPSNIITLDTLVSRVNYADMFDNYIPTEYAFRVINIIKLIHGERGEENKTPLVHYHMLDQIINHQSTLLVAARGLAKTSLVRYAIFDAAVYGEIPKHGNVSVAMYISDTAENGVKTFFTGLKYLWDNSEFLQAYLPNARFTQDECELKNKEGHELFIRGSGVSTGVRGFTRYNKRPSMAIFDDLFTDKNAQSPTVVKDIEAIIYGAIEQSLHPTRRKVIWVGTPFNKKDPLYKAAGSTAWHTAVYPVCNRFPCNKDNFIGAWEDRFTFDSINTSYKKLKAMGKEDSFNQELMLRILSSEDRLVNEDDIVWYNRDKLLAQKHYYNWYITSDFATSEKDSADYSTLMIWAYNANGDWMLVDGYLERIDMSVNIKRLFDYVKMYEPITSVGIETTGQQKGFVSWIKQEMVNKSMYFTLAADNRSGEAGLRPASSKLVRFNGVLPMFKTKKIWFPNELKDTPFMLELMEEITNVTKSGIKSNHDDGIDAVSMLSQLSAWKPSGKSEESIAGSYDSPFDKRRQWKLPERNTSYIV